MSIVDQPEHAAAVDEHLGRHSSQFEYTDLLPVEIKDSMVGIGQADERQFFPGPIFLKCGRIFRTNDHNHAVVPNKIRVILAQLRQVPAAEGSEKAAIEDEQDIVSTNKIGQSHHGAVEIGKGEERGRGVTGDGSHAGILNWCDCLSAGNGLCAWRL